MTNMGMLLKLIGDGNCNIQDVAADINDVDKVFSVSKKLITFPMTIDFIKLKEYGFEPLSIGRFDSNVDELIIKYVR